MSSRVSNGRQTTATKDAYSLWPVSFVACPRAQWTSGVDTPTQVRPNWFSTNFCALCVHEHACTLQKHCAKGPTCSNRKGLNARDGRVVPYARGPELLRFRTNQEKRLTSQPCESTKNRQETHNSDRRDKHVRRKTNHSSKADS